MYKNYTKIGETHFFLLFSYFFQSVCLKHNHQNGTVSQKIVKKYLVKALVLRDEIQKILLNLPYIPTGMSVLQPK